MTYLIILAIYFLVALALHKVMKIKLYDKAREKNIVFVWFTTIFISGLICDLFATYKQIWIFPGNGIIGLRFFWLPIEEFLFFMVVPYFVLVLYEVLNKIL